MIKQANTRLTITLSKVKSKTLKEKAKELNTTPSTLIVLLMFALDNNEETKKFIKKINDFAKDLE